MNAMLSISKMSDIQINAYLYNIQLTKLVSSADVLLQHVYDLLSPQINKELRDSIATWLCDKQEVDGCLSNNRMGSDSDLSSSASFESNNSFYLSDESGVKSETEDVTVNSYAKIVGKSKLICSKNDVQVKNIASNSNTPNFNQCSISETSLNNSSFKFCRYCSNETNECSPFSSLPIDEQIEQLHKIREPVLQNCQNVTKYTRRRDLENNPHLKQLFVFQEILELIDMSIEVKNDPRVMNQMIQDLISANFLAYSTICNCLKILSANEIRYFFIVFMQKIVEVRASSYPLDKLILQLDNDIVDKEVRLQHLNKNYEKLKEACISLSKKTGNRFGFSRNPPLDDLCRILKTSHITERKDEDNLLLPCSNFSYKTIRSPTTLLNVPSKSLCVSRQGKKLVIHHNTNS